MHEEVNLVDNVNGTVFFYQVNIITAFLIILCA